MAARRLKRGEITALEARGCRARDWGRVSVAEGFSPGDRFRGVDFSGDVFLGLFEAEPEADPDRRPGIEDARLHNARIGDNCRIRRASLSDVEIGEGSLIEEVGEFSGPADEVSTEPPRANVLAEDGARSVPIGSGLSAQLAHLLCHLKNTAAAGALESMFRREAAAGAREGSRAGRGCRIRRCGRLINAWLGDGARLEGVSRLENCRVESRADCPTWLGEGVVARASVFLAGSETLDGVGLANCLVGEGARLENGFSAGHSLFFANSHMALGEAVSVLAGPFSVSHHKATLLLACQCSFGNFGSAANSSNHHFKLGPRHGGILRRGVNLGSGSYLPWPSDLGAFTTLIGRHPRRLDVPAFPFSLLLAGDKGSLLLPGANLFSAGGFRDARKWRERERRPVEPRPLGAVNPAVLSPYAIQALDRGTAILEQAAPGDAAHGGAVIPAGRRRAALELYEWARVFYLGEGLLAAAREAGGGGAASTREVLGVLASAGKDGRGDGFGGEWRDWGGMLLPGDLAGRFLSSLAGGELDSLAAARDRLWEIHSRYGELETAWIADRWRRDYGPPGAGAVSRFFARWREAVAFRRDRILADMAKEFGEGAQIGFGVEEEAGEAFARVRGRPDDKAWPSAVREESGALLSLADGVGS